MVVDGESRNAVSSSIQDRLTNERNHRGKNQGYFDQDTDTRKKFWLFISCQVT
jgi:hypothetical protein